MTSVDANLKAEAQNDQQTLADSASGGYAGLKWLIIINIIFSFNIYSVLVVADFDMLNRSLAMWSAYIFSSLLLVVGLFVSYNFFVDASKHLKKVVVWAAIGFAFNIFRPIFVGGFIILDNYYPFWFFSYVLPLLLFGCLLYYSTKKYRSYLMEHSHKKLTS